MASARITAQDLDTIIRLATTDPRQPFIEAAETIVNQLEGFPAAAPLTTAELKLIELWLAAHYAAIAHPQPGTFSDAGRSRSLDIGAGQTGFNSTRYGRAALGFDRSGRLQSFSNATQEAQLTFVSSNDPNDV